jgi:vacuolar protein sorting-associated protein 54
MPSSDIEATSPTRTSIENLKDTRMARTASGVKLSYLASSSQSTQPNTGGNPPPSPLVAPMTSHHRPLARERPYARDDYNNSNSNGSNRPASIRSATSFGRPLSRFAQGNHTRHHSNYSNFSTMSETALPWTTKDIGFNAISGNNNNNI